MHSLQGEESIQTVVMNTQQPGGNTDNLDSSSLSAGPISGIEQAAELGFRQTFQSIIANRLSRFLALTGIHRLGWGEWALWWVCV